MAICRNYELLFLFQDFRKPKYPHFRVFCFFGFLAQSNVFMFSWFSCVLGFLLLLCERENFAVTFNGWPGLPNRATLRGRAMCSQQELADIFGYGDVDTLEQRFATWGHLLQPLSSAVDFVTFLNLVKVYPVRTVHRARMPGGFSV